MDFQSIRRKTKKIAVGGVYIGQDAPIAIQSMTNTDPHHAQATANQILRLQQAGCDIVRLTIPDIQAAECLAEIRRLGASIPIVADIHFDYRVALRCAELGFDKIRINPGNIGDDDRVRQVADACRQRGIPIRIGVNGGSLEKTLLAKHGGPTPQALCESALYHIQLLEKHNFEDIVVSIKASSVENMIAANRLIADRCSYPLHLGVTEAGDRTLGEIKSAIGIGSLLCDGIGDTIRVSLTNDPVDEIVAARKILNALQIKGQSGMDIVSCPTCGRTQIDLISLSEQFRSIVQSEGLERLPIKVALMGCVVNGPGEAREADVGIAGGNGEGLLFRRGETVKKVKEQDLTPALVREIRMIAQEMDKKS